MKYILKKKVIGVFYYIYEESFQTFDPFGPGGPGSVGIDSSEGTPFK